MTTTAMKFYSFLLVQVCNQKDRFSSIFFQKWHKLCLVLFSLSFVLSIQANEVINVSGGNVNAPFYSFTDSTGGVIDLSTYSFQKGLTYDFVDGGVSSSHPFMVGEDTVNNSPHVSGTPLNGLGTTLTLTIPAGFSGSFLYFCTVHPLSMQANLTLTEAATPSSGGGGAIYNVYQISHTQYQSIKDVNAPDRGSSSFPAHVAIVNEGQWKMKTVTFLSGGVDSVSITDDQYNLASGSDLWSESLISAFSISTQSTLDTFFSASGYPLQGTYSPSGGNTSPDGGYQSPSGGYTTPSGGNTSPSGGVLPVYQLTAAHITFLADTSSGVTLSGNYSFIEVTNGSVIEIQIPVMYDNAGTWEPQASLTYPSHPTNITSMTDVQAYLASQNLQPINLSELPSSYQSPSAGYTTPSGGYTSPDSGYQTPSGGYTSPDSGYQTPSGGYPSPDNGYQSPTANMGIPVFNLTALQVSSLSDKGVSTSAPGNYAFVFITDPVSLTTSQELEPAILDIYGKWDFSSDVVDSIPVTLVNFENYFISQNLQPVGFIDLEIENPNPEPFDFTEIDNIDLSNPEELHAIAKDFDAIFFQYYPLPNHQSHHEETDSNKFESDLFEDAGAASIIDAKEVSPDNLNTEPQIVWILSIENEQDDGAVEAVQSNLVIDMDGNVFAGDFEAYWKDAYEVNTDDNSEWKEFKYSTDTLAIDQIYQEHPEIAGLVVEEKIPPFDFTEIDRIDLSNPEELHAIAKDFDAIYFQYYTIYPDALNTEPQIVWILSIENEQDDGAVEAVQSNLVIDMDGNVFAGDFEAYWKDAYEVNTDEDPEWKEFKYTTDVLAIDQLYQDYAEIAGGQKGEVDFDFTEIGEIDLSKPEELVQLAKGFGNIYFQSYLINSETENDDISIPNDSDSEFKSIDIKSEEQPTLLSTIEAIDSDSSSPETEIFWLISLEDHEDPQQPNLLVGMDGMVAVADLESFWRDVAEVDTEKDSNWNEFKYSTDSEGIENLYFEHPEIAGGPIKSKPEPFDFTEIDQIDLSNPEELAQLAKGYESIYFQSYLLDSSPFDDNDLISPDLESKFNDSNPDTFYESSQKIDPSNPGSLYSDYEDNPLEPQIIWILSIEDHQDPGQPNLVVDMDGIVFAGDFDSFWMDVVEVDIKNDPDWYEAEYLADFKGIETLYSEYPEVSGMSDELDYENNLLKQSIVQIFEFEDNLDGSFLVNAELIRTSDSPVFEVGVILAESMDFEFTDRFVSSLEEDSTFSLLLSGLDPGTNYYFKAFTIDENGEFFSSVRKLTVPSSDSWYSETSESTAGWRSSDWFGSFQRYENDWIYHESLGWAFVIPDQGNGIWIWTPDYNWQWTQQGTWPFLYRNETGNWLYFVKRINGRPIFFDYEAKSYLISPPLIP